LCIGGATSGVVVLAGGIDTCVGWSFAASEDISKPSADALASVRSFCSVDVTVGAAGVSELRRVDDADPTTNASSLVSSLVTRAPVAESLVELLLLFRNISLAELIALYHICP
jgi:hypothetical protein